MISCALCSFYCLTTESQCYSCHFTTKSIKAFEESGLSISNKRLQSFPLEMRIKHPAKQWNIEAYNTSHAEFDQIPHFLHCLLARDFQSIIVTNRQISKITRVYCRSKKSLPEQFFKRHTHCFCCARQLNAVLLPLVFRISWRIKVPSFHD